MLAKKQKVLQDYNVLIKNISFLKELKYFKILHSLHVSWSCLFLLLAGEQ